MAVEQDLLANLTDAERAELEQRAIQLRELKKKVGTQRALQIIGSGFAIAGNKPELLPHLTPKFGYTADEIASRKGALRRERHALMGEDEAAKQFSQTLLKDVGSATRTLSSAASNECIPLLRERLATRQEKEGTSTPGLVMSRIRKDRSIKQ